MIDSTMARDRESFLILKNLMAIFVKQTPKLFQQIRKAIEADNTELILRSTEVLRTGCDHLGWDEIVSICDEIHQVSQKGNLNHCEVSMLLDKVEHIYEELTERNQVWKA